MATHPPPRRGTDCTGRRGPIDREGPRPALAGAVPREPGVDIQVEPRAAIRIDLMSGFGVTHGGHSLDLPRSAQRLVALVALLNRPALRHYVAGTLWLDTSEDRALANLRSALWRLRRPGLAILDTSGDRLSLAAGVFVDVRELTAWAHGLDRRDPMELDDGRLDQLVLADEILPDWYDDWLLLARERFRQVRLHALEACCVQLASVGRFGRAIELGLAAVAAESLRESAHRALIRAYIAEGNLGEAMRQYKTYRRILRRELRLDPSPLIEQLVAGLRTA